MTIHPNYFLFALILITIIACKKDKKTETTESQLYANYCASCHIAPKIEELPKAIWKNNVLPDMADRMKVIGEFQDPNQEERFRPEISLRDWVRLKNYIVEMAPETLASNKIPQTKLQKRFKEYPIAFGAENGALITYLEIMDGGDMAIGTYSGQLFKWDYPSKKRMPIANLTTAITDYSINGESHYVTEVGILDPSETSQGAVARLTEKDTLQIADKLHRPVNTLVDDLNGNGNLELVVNEFGHETGALTLFYLDEDQTYHNKTLINLPGCIRTVSKDMDNDGMLDLITMTTQGNESITILYQKEDLTFKAKRVIEFSPVYGSSWFELIDFNRDGFMDIATVNGDNADKSYVHKPYHGMRIYLNDGKNNFEEVYFYPLYGATRVVANDFDQDGDIDFALLSTFPDYQNNPEMSFVYLENYDANTFEFKTHVLNQPALGRWFLMDAGDIDGDGDDDLVLTSFTYVFTPVPMALAKKWNETNIDILVLENTLE